MKRIKMLIYGEPGVGKSVFASKSPNPFFITTDGNYEWLEDFGAKTEAHQQVNSWEEAKKLFEQDFTNYDTIVVDLLEDLFKWCEQEYCIRAKLDHVSDVGYGKGYDITRNEFFLEISKLLGKDKNVILISHGITFEVKDRRGVTHTKYAPSSRIPDKVMDMIEGRLRYCLRCYAKAEEQADGTLVKNRYLSLVPKENEFGIIRGVNENEVPHDIILDWNEFTKAIKFDNTKTTVINSSITTSTLKINDTKVSIIKEEVLPGQVTVEEVIKEEPKMETIKDDSMKIPETKEVKKETKVVEEVKEEKQEVQEESKPVSNQDKIAAIKAKLAAMQNMNK